MNQDIIDWGARHGVSTNALNELRQIMGTHRNIMPPASYDPAMSEAGVQSRVRLAAANAGYLVFRNNVGAMEDTSGRVVRFGLCNDSKALNARIKSSDLIGIKPNGQFWARECKPASWHYTGTDREVAQSRFIELIRSMGGDAAFSVGSI